MKTYILKPIMTPVTLTRTPTLDKPAVGRTVPPRQPLPTAVIDPAKPLLKLGLDVHLEFIMAVAQKDHGNPHAPRKFTRPELVAQVGKWVAEGFQVFCVEESFGFGFVLHRELVAAGAQSFLITPIALNGQRKTDKLDARALCLRLSRWLDGNRDELAPNRFMQKYYPRQFEGNSVPEYIQVHLEHLCAIAVEPDHLCGSDLESEGYREIFILAFARHPDICLNLMRFLRQRYDRKPAVWKALRTNPRFQFYEADTAKRVNKDITELTTKDIIDFVAQEYGEKGISLKAVDKWREKLVKADRAAWKSRLNRLCSHFPKQLRTALRKSHIAARKQRLASAKKPSET